MAFYTEPARMTSVGRYAPLVQALPRDVAALAAVAQGLVVHEHIASTYGVTLTDEDRETVHIRPAERLLDRILGRDDRPLDVARPPAERIAGNCRHFTVLLVAMLRAHGVPARARCGFGDYFRDGYLEDHWVCEYRREDGRWVLVDAQLDPTQRELFGIDFDVTDVPRDRFLIAGDAWARCRAGTADPAAFGLSFLKEAGYWWIAGNLMRDAAALRNVEVLPWDVWGVMPGPNEEISPDDRDLFDRLAALTATPDAAFDELARLYEDERLRVPPMVRNTQRERAEPL
jgi:hypothetical protein